MIRISHNYNLGSRGDREVLVVWADLRLQSFVFFSLSTFLKNGSSLLRLVLVAACSSLSGNEMGGL
jgi:hypothetical protein